MNALMAQFGSQGLKIIGYPCAQFDNQEPGDNNEILPTLYYVRPGNNFVPAFPLTQKVNVNGVLVDPVMQYLKNACPPVTSTVAGLAPSWSPIMVNDLQWNFESWLVDRTGQPYRRYATAVDPTAVALDIKYLLAQSA